MFYIEAQAFTVSHPDFRSMVCNMLADAYGYFRNYLMKLGTGTTSTNWSKMQWNLFHL